MKKATISLLIFLINIGILLAQAPERMHSGEFYQALRKLNVLGNVLYLAAHPDDENTRLIAYLANEELVNTAYLSLTRGDGGQNLIGPEIRDALGLIRTQELLGARDIDGGTQFFTRANDFGYSKHPDETFNIWDRDQVLADVVWTIRKFKPDVIVTRFNTTPGTTHGHHTASAILAGEAFDLAADPEAYPEQLEYVETWQPKKLFWNTSSWFYRNRDDFDTTNLVKVDVGAYSPVLGESYTEIAAKSRSMHKSQGFGVSGSRGQEIEYLSPTKRHQGDSLFSGLDLNWSRLEGGSGLENMITNVLEKYEPAHPENILPDLLSIRSEIRKIDNEFWKEIKLNEIDQLIKSSLGLYLDASSSQYTVTPGDSVRITVELVNRTAVDVELVKVTFNPWSSVRKLNRELQNNKTEEIVLEEIVPENTPYSQPYWLRESGTKGMFKVENQTMIGLPENPAAFTTGVIIKVNDQEIDYHVPVIYKTSDRAVGEIFKPFMVTPPVFSNFSKDILIFPDQQSQQVEVKVMAGRADLNGSLELKAPNGWKISPECHDFSLKQAQEEKLFIFNISPPAGQSTGKIKAIAKLENGEHYDLSLQTIEYNHIPAQMIFPPAEASVVKIDIQATARKIGYLEGAGDVVGENLRQAGFDVNYLTREDLITNDLDQYDAIVVGVRAFNTLDHLKFDNSKLFEYAERGGTLVVQYNTTYGLITEEVAPHSLKISRDRVTVEEADVKMLAPDHPVLNYPNKITSQDFEGWVQERGLYFPNEWDEAFTPILSSHDPGDDPLEGGLLVAKYGEGYYVYTGYSWFRQLPAGVPGAFRIFANILSLGN